jgi:hypothetical protein
MKLFTKLFLMVVIASLFAILPSNAGGGKDKVLIIHKGKLISVAPEAIRAHAAHGDSFPITLVSGPNAQISVEPTAVLCNETGTWSINVTASDVGPDNPPTTTPYKIQILVNEVPVPDEPRFTVIDNAPIQWSWPVGRDITISVSATPTTVPTHD